MSPTWRFSRSKKQQHFSRSPLRPSAVLCQRGKIPFARIGDHIRLLQSDIEALFRPQEPKTMSREESLRLLGIDLSLP